MASAMPPQLRFRFRPRRAQAHPNDQFRISQGTTKQRVPHVSCLSRRGSQELHHYRPPNNCHLERSSFFAKRRSDAVERSPGAGEPNNAQGNSDKNPARRDDESATTAVILRQWSPWQRQGLPTKDLCTPWRFPRNAELMVPTPQSCAADTLVRGLSHNRTIEHPTRTCPAFLSDPIQAGAPPLSLRSLER
jgi:hypothetical protein